MNNIETKSYSFREGSSLAYSTLDAYHSFGWEESSREDIDVRRSHGRHHEETNIIFIRDKTMPHYDEIRKLEEKYEHDSNQFWTYQQASGGLAFFLLLLFLVPGIIYIAYKCNQKDSVYSHNAEVSNDMIKCVAEANKLKKGVKI